MSITMRGVATAGALAVGALGVVGASAEAGNDGSPFAGKYTWSRWNISIPSQGAVNGSYNFSQPYMMGATVTYKGTMRGAVSSAGALSIDMTETTTYKHLWDGLWDQGTYVKTAGSSDSSTSTSSSHLDAVVSLDVDGNLVGTTSTGQALVWLRQ